MQLWIKDCTRNQEVKHWRSQVIVLLQTCLLDVTLCIYEDLDSLHAVIHMYFLLKPNSVRLPDIQFGTKPKLMQVENRFWNGGINPVQYVREALKSCMDYISRPYHNSFDYLS